MSFQIMASNETLVAMIAFELSVTKMCLNMGFYVFFPSESLHASVEGTYPLIVYGIGTFNIPTYILKRNSSFL